MLQQLQAGVGTGWKFSEDFIACCNIIHKQILQQGNNIALLGLADPDNDDLNKNNDDDANDVMHTV